MLGDEAVQRVRQHRTEGRVRLGVMDDYGALILPPILKSFANTYPGIALQMETGLTSGMVGRLGRAYDIVIAMHEAGEQTGEFLRRERAVWAGPASINPRSRSASRRALSERMSVPEVGFGRPRPCRTAVAARVRQPQPGRRRGDRQSGFGRHGREIRDTAAIAGHVRARGRPSTAAAGRHPVALCARAVRGKRAPCTAHSRESRLRQGGGDSDTPQTAISTTTLVGRLTCRTAQPS
jgi:DNA-binding transcriptional LysR family regulator